jgi:hypothetical protein
MYLSPIRHTSDFAAFLIDDIIGMWMVENGAAMWEEYHVDEDRCKLTISADGRSLVRNDGCVE